MLKDFFKTSENVCKNLENDFMSVKKSAVETASKEAYKIILLIGLQKNRLQCRTTSFGKSGPSSIILNSSLL